MNINRFEQLISHLDKFLDSTSIDRTKSMQRYMTNIAQRISTATISELDQSQTDIKSTDFIPDKPRKITRKEPGRLESFTGEFKKETPEKIDVELTAKSRQRGSFLPPLFIPAIPIFLPWIPLFSRDPTSSPVPTPSPVPSPVPRQQTSTSSATSKANASVKAFIPAPVPVISGKIPTHTKIPKPQKFPPTPPLTRPLTRPITKPGPGPITKPGPGLPGGPQVQPLKHPKLTFKQMQQKIFFGEKSKLATLRQSRSPASGGLTINRGQTPGTTSSRSGSGIPRNRLSSGTAAASTKLKMATGFPFLAAQLGIHWFVEGKLSERDFAQAQIRYRRDTGLTAEFIEYFEDYLESNPVTKDEIDAIRYIPDSPHNLPSSNIDSSSTLQQQTGNTDPDPDENISYRVVEIYNEEDAYPIALENKYQAALSIYYNQVARPVMLENFMIEHLSNPYRTRDAAKHLNKVIEDHPAIYKRTHSHWVDPKTDDAEDWNDLHFKDKPDVPLRAKLPSEEIKELRKKVIESIPSRSNWIKDFDKASEKRALQGQGLVNNYQSITTATQGLIASAKMYSPSRELFAVNTAQPSSTGAPITIQDLLHEDSSHNKDSLNTSNFFIDQIA